MKYATHWVIQVCCSQSCSHANHHDPYLCTDTQTITKATLAPVSVGGRLGLGGHKMHCPESCNSICESMGFDSKCNFAHSTTILLGLLLPLEPGSFFLVDSNILLSIVCSAASCNFGVHTGEDEHMTFYSSVLFVDVSTVIGDWKEKAGS